MPAYEARDAALLWPVLGLLRLSGHPCALRHGLALHHRLPEPQGLLAAYAAHSHAVEPHGTDAHSQSADSVGSLLVDSFVEPPSRTRSRNISVLGRRSGRSAPPQGTPHSGTLGGPPHLPRQRRNTGQLQRYSSPPVPTAVWHPQSMPHSSLCRVING